jgi:hypothetical protein
VILVIYGCFWLFFASKFVVTHLIKTACVNFSPAHLAALDFGVGGTTNSPRTSGCRGPEGRNGHFGGFWLILPDHIPRY